MFFDELPNLELQQQINLLEGDQFRDLSLRPFDLSVLNNFFSLSIQSIKAPVKKLDNQPNFFPSIDFLISLYQLKLPLRYFVQYQNNEIKTNLLITEKEKEIIINITRDYFSSSNSPVIKASFQPFSKRICFTGIPHNRLTSKTKSILQSLVAGLQGTRWQLFIIANPIPDQSIQQYRAILRERIEAVDIQYLQGEIKQKDRAAQHYIKLLEYHVNRLQTATNEGLWQVGIYFLSDETNAANIGGGIICSILHNSSTYSIPMRFNGFSNQSSQNSMINQLTGRELVSCFRMPEIELPGLKIEEIVPFDIDNISANQSEQSIEIGSVLDNQKQNSYPASIVLSNLQKHTLVSGVTGSGKTNTIFQILYQNWTKNKIPFLVIEPAKSEYRNLFRLIPQLRVYTIGFEEPENSLPIRLNPFYFLDGISLQSHIDYLKNVFFSSFTLYPPMPFVLEECLYRVYLDKGWNLIDSSNSRGISPQAYPTLDDLFYKIAEVVERLGYEERLAMDIRAALETRINSLRMGSKGLMLNTRMIMDFDALFQQPTVLELKYMGNDDEKSFLMALILCFLYEYREKNKTQNNELHLLVIEEAHRLLRNTDKHKMSDKSNIKAEAIEFFSNILAEVRAYNQGVIIADQIPSQLASEAIKNTNLKITHRLVAFDERETIGQAMACNEKQRQYLVQLNTGEAVLFQEGMDRPNRIKIHKLDLAGKQVPNNQELLRIHSEANKIILKREELIKGSQLEPTLERFLNSEQGRFAIAKLLLNVLLSTTSKNVKVSFIEFKHRLNESVFKMKQSDTIVQNCIILLLGKEIEFRGNFYETAYTDLEQQRRTIHTIVESFFSKNINSNWEKLLTDFRNTYYKLKKDAPGPLPGCIYCKSSCLFRYEGNLLAKNTTFHVDFLEIFESSEENLWGDLLKTTLYKIKDFYENEDHHQFRDLTLCFINHKMNALNLSAQKSNFVVKDIDRIL